MSVNCLYESYTFCDYNICITMFELILSTIKDNLIKVKQEIIAQICYQISKDTAEVRTDLLEIKKMLQDKNY